ncbi:dehydrogenase [Mobiluncus mulieris]|nr:dehydrogenase [Mobiluncus mulieris]MCV0014911.1 dehydrogenase [Mobiluncus mulieris]NMW60582.1 dehydrogenase [Mobiluncus mulieris]NMW63870.1 dehydrogenase [Mobiluncus mulieris]
MNVLRVGKHLAVHNPVPGGAAQVEELAGVAQPGESAVVKALPR